MGVYEFKIITGLKALYQPGNHNFFATFTSWLQLPAQLYR